MHSKVISMRHDAMNNKRTFINEDGTETLFYDYNTSGLANQTPKIAAKYTFVDLDGDDC